MVMEDESTRIDGDGPMKRGSVSGQDFMTKKEINRIRMFRLMVASLLVMTAVVTVIAYFFLSNQETRNFETAYYQFARTLADAALEQQQNLRDACKSLANEITAYAQQNNDSWPFVVLPLFESYAIGFFDHSRAEFVGVQNLVKHDERDAFINWTTANYQDWIEEAHMIQHGHLDYLDTDPTWYHPYLSQKGPNTTYPPDEIRPYYSARVCQSPPARAYGPTFNLNIATIPGIADVIDGVIALKNETLVTRVKPFNAVYPKKNTKVFTQIPRRTIPIRFCTLPFGVKSRTRRAES